MLRLKTEAPIHDTLTGYDFTKDKALPIRKAIRQKCLECQCGKLAEVRRCQITDCALWPWRLGRGVVIGMDGAEPIVRLRDISDAQRENLRKASAAKELVSK